MPGEGELSLMKIYSSSLQRHSPRFIIRGMHRSRLPFEEGGSRMADPSTTETAGSGRVIHHVDNESLLPFCDLAGYACFLSWTFVIGWFEGIAPLECSENVDLSLLRIPFLTGIAIVSCLLLLMGKAPLVAKRKGLVEFSSFACSAICSIAFFLKMPPEATFTFWFVAGGSQALCFFIWSLRLRVLSQSQQKSTIYGAFVIGGLTLALWPFMDESLMKAVVSLLPLASYICLIFARRHFPATEDIKLPDGASGSLLHSLRKGIPRKADRKFIFMKGLHTVLYSFFFGFSTCASLAPWFYPFNEIVIGVACAVAALVMALLLRVDEPRTCNVLPNLFLPVTGLCMLLIGLLWPQPLSLAFCFLLITLYVCYEILNARTSYAYSDYDSIRCLWELRASKAGSAIGFLLGWCLADAALYVLRLNETALVSLSFLMVIFLAVANDLLFKQSKLVFGEIPSNEDDHMGVLDMKSFKPDLDTPGKWSSTCDELSKKYRLSPRQKEIFLMLAKGRNVQYIRDELVLSTPTVKSHIYSIYQKMGIHSHQELIDAIENAVKEKEG